MTARHRVDLDHLAGIVDEIGRFDQRLEAALGEIDARVNRLHTTWTGVAAAKHRQAYEQWQRGIDEMRAGLLLMQRNAQVARTNYTSAANTNARMWEQAR